MSTPAIHVRAACPGDLEAVLAIGDACFGESAWTRDQWMPALARTLVSEADAGGVVGYAVVQDLGVEAELEALAVAFAHRRHGVGRCLWHAATQHARQRGARAIFLEVRESNAAGLAFYRAAGCQADGRRAGYYRQPAEAALLFRLSLAD